MPVLGKLKSAYILWHEYHEKIPKTQKYSLGNRIDKIFVEVMEAVIGASFLPKTEKIPFVKAAIRKLDLLKIFVMILWETKTLNDNRYSALSLPLDDAGKMLGGWNGQLQKQNSPELSSREK